MNRLTKYFSNEFTSPDFEGMDFHSQYAEPVTSVYEGHSLFVPEPYEERYAYPLIVVLGNPKGSTDDFFQMMEQISSQNYIGVEVASPVLKTRAGLEKTFEQVESAVGQVRQRCNIHTERIVLMGVGPQAATAVDLVLQSHDKFWGFVAIDPQPGQLKHPLAGFRGLQQRRGFFVAPPENKWIHDTATSLHEAGLHIHLERQDAEELSQSVPSLDTCRRIDRVLMHGIWEATLRNQ